jgi:hypothetical protein
LGLSDQRLYWLLLLDLSHLSDRGHPLGPRLLLDLSGRLLDLSDQPHLEDQWHQLCLYLLHPLDLLRPLDLSDHLKDQSDQRLCWQDLSDLLGLLLPDLLHLSGLSNREPIYLVDLSDLSDRRLYLLHPVDQWVQLCLCPGHLEDLTDQLAQLNRELKHLADQWVQSDQ